MYHSNKFVSSKEETLLGNQIFPIKLMLNFENIHVTKLKYANEITLL